MTGIQTVHCPAPSTLSELRDVGAAVVPGVFSEAQIEAARERVLGHRDLLRNTRPTPSAGHLAGFHRYPDLEPLHAMLTGHPVIRDAMESLCGPGVRTIGLSDITVNRSQQWHKDLLRGDFQELLGHDRPCEAWHGHVFKVIVYLQDSRSLQVVPGSHREDICLDSDEYAIPGGDVPLRNLEARSGDIVLIDICTTHRGSTESAFATEDAERHPKILVSTVFGRADSPLTRRMELGNLHRQAAWMKRHGVDF